jgi:hypothetical protein
MAEVAQGHGAEEPSRRGDKRPLEDPLDGQAEKKARAHDKQEEVEDEEDMLQAQLRFKCVLGECKLMRNIVKALKNVPYAQYALFSMREDGIFIFCESNLMKVAAQVKREHFSSYPWRPRWQPVDAVIGIKQLSDAFKGMPSEGSLAVAIRSNQSSPALSFTCISKSKAEKPKPPLRVYDEAYMAGEYVEIDQAPPSTKSHTMKATSYVYLLDEAVEADNLEALDKHFKYGMSFSSATFCQAISYVKTHQFVKIVIDHGDQPTSLLMTMYGLDHDVSASRQISVEVKNCEDVPPEDCLPRRTSLPPSILEPIVPMRGDDVDVKLDMSDPSNDGQCFLRISLAMEGASFHAYCAAQEFA